MDSEDKYFIEAILDSQIYYDKLQYLVKWIGYDRPDWEPAKLHSESKAVNRFHEKYSGKPGPLSDTT
jgi:hypothetical protein